jgi:glucokinase
LTNEFISAEWLFCGKGIPLLYEFYSLKEGKILEKPVLGEEVFKNIETDPISRKSFEHFLRILGTCLAHLAVAFLPDEGIFLCGTILKSVIKHIQKDTSDPAHSLLISSFINNKCAGPYLQTVPIFFTPEVDLGLKGCWHFLQILHKV